MNKQLTPEGIYVSCL